MINIRSNVFETNSSSSHSVSLHFPLSDKGMLETVKLGAKGNLVLNGGDFASTEIDLESAMDKINFVAVYIMVYGDEDLKARFESVVREHTGASEIKYNIRFTYAEGKKANTFFSPEYFNTEDCGYYGEYCDFEIDDEDEIEIKSHKCIQFNDILKDDNKLKVFLFHDRAKLVSQITSG